MRAEIRELQKSLGITAIYVTHDQEEAMSVSDRIALMQSGRLEQVGAPAEIYRNPRARASRRNSWARPTCWSPRRWAFPAPAWFLLRSARPCGSTREAPAGWPRALAAPCAHVEVLGPITRFDVRLGDGSLIRWRRSTSRIARCAPGADVTLAYDPARVTLLPMIWP